jgi:F0F1-type ATP synthase assembly protein I
MTDDDDGAPAGRYRDVRRIVAEGKDKRRAGKAQLYALEIPVAVILGAVLGHVVDDHFGVAPWGVSVGLAAGVGAAIRAIVRLIAWQKQNDREDGVVDDEGGGHG